MRHDGEYRDKEMFFLCCLFCGTTRPQGQCQGASQAATRTLLFHMSATSSAISSPAPCSEDLESSRVWLWGLGPCIYMGGEEEAQELA